MVMVSGYIMGEGVFEAECLCEFMSVTCHSVSLRHWASGFSSLKWTTIGQNYIIVYQRKTETQALKKERKNVLVKTARVFAM